MVRWPLQTLQPLQKTQLQPPFGPSVDSLCHPWFTTTNLSYRFPIFETSATALCSTTGIRYYRWWSLMVFWWLLMFFLMVGGCWWLLVADGGWWWLMVIDGRWWVMRQSSKNKRTLKKEQSIYSPVWDMSCHPSWSRQCTSPKMTILNGPSFFSLMASCKTTFGEMARRHNTQSNLLFLGW